MEFLAKKPNKEKTHSHYVRSDVQKDARTLSVRSIYMRNISVCLICFVLVACISKPQPKIEELSNLRKLILGEWAWNIENCKKSPQIYSFSADGSKMFVDSGEGLIIGNRNKVLPRVTYNILAEKGNVLRTSVEGEDRFVDISTRVKWDLVMLNINQFCWHRTDWAPHACTKPMSRCTSGS